MAKKKYAIDYSEFITVNGDRQNIRVRSRSADLPVLLFLHGGPGVCDRNWVIKYQSDLSEVCTMVCWDQRASGKSCTKASLNGSITVEMMIEDACAVVDELCRRFGKEKIYIVGHSWGSILGVMLAKRIPEKIAYYIGMGQFVEGAENERLSYEFCLNEARRVGDDKVVAKLEKGAPVNGMYPDKDAMMLQRDCLTKYGGAEYHCREGIVKSLLIPLIKSDEYSLPELVKYARGALTLPDKLWGEVIANNFFETASKLDVPVLITQGRHDYNTPSEIVSRWIDMLDAPAKEIVWFEESAHSPIKEEPELWGRVIREKIFS